METRYASDPESLVFYTDTDESDYPIFISAENEIWMKARPRVIETVDDDGYERQKKVYGEVKAVFFVKSVLSSKNVDENEHPLLKTAIDIMREVTKHDLTVKKLVITYEVYQGDMERLLGETQVSCIKIISSETPFSGCSYDGKKAFAIGYDWKKRIVAKCPKVERYIYIHGEKGKRERAYVKVVVKLPLSNPEFEKLFKIAILENTAVAEIDEIKKKIEETEEKIKVKKEELEMLQKELSRLKMQLGLEKTKETLGDES